MILTYRLEPDGINNKKNYYLAKLLIKLNCEYAGTKTRDWDYIQVCSHDFTIHSNESAREPDDALDPYHIKIYPKGISAEIAAAYYDYIIITFKSSTPFRGKIVVEVYKIDTNTPVGNPYTVKCWIWNDIHLDTTRLIDYIIDKL
jgi:hypothetical protein